jgi:ATP synthase protein I
MRNQIIKSLILQYALAMVYLAGAGLWDKAVLLSALVGCMASLLPNTYFSIRMLQAADNNNALQWLGVAYRSEIGKWLMTGMIFIFAFNLDYPWDPVFMFAGFSLMLLSGWLLPFVTKGN